METALKFNVDNLEVKVFKNRSALGKEAAIDVGLKIKSLLKDKDEIRMVFAAAPSQNEFLENFTNQDIEWNRIIAFHMDEYIGLKNESNQLFSSYLKENLFNKVKFKHVFYLNSINDDNFSECKRYSDLINEKPIDIICMGIGENGHVAFNDPPVANFNDSEIVKIVELDKACRVQQVNDGCFSKLEEVPKSALTLTIPVLLSGGYLSIVVPGKRKAEAVYGALFNDVSIMCPATILRNHNNALLYLDNDSFNLASKKIKSSGNYE